ncbi:MAG: hypothetical protein ABI876_16255, partial [Bacteroidota bacterium]
YRVAGSADNRERFGNAGMRVISSHRVRGHELAKVHKERGGYESRPSPVAFDQFTALSGGGHGAGVTVTDGQPLQSQFSQIFTQQPGVQLMLLNRTQSPGIF